MDSYDVVIVGGGPAGSSCAWALKRAGPKVAILDRRTFPRNKVCGGWITPAVLEELQIEPAEYGKRGVLQPITGFRTSYMGGREVETNYRRPVSYGIRRSEFDDYLLRRSGASLLLGATLTRLERSGGDWIVNDQFRSPVLVGAGGTFCPVVRFLGAKVSGEVTVGAQEAEIELDEQQLSECSVRGEIPQLYFCSDMKGYGWCFRKCNLLNVGLGRLDPHSLCRHVSEFLKLLKLTRRISQDLSPELHGHAYLLFSETTRKPVSEGVLLIGDAAGVAYTQSGEGIRPAIESGLLAARVIADAQGHYTRDRLESYRDLLAKRFGNSDSNWTARIVQRLPAGVVSSIARRLLETHWFAREVVLNRWFLRQSEPALQGVSV